MNGVQGREGFPTKLLTAESRQMFLITSEHVFHIKTRSLCDLMTAVLLLKVDLGGKKKVTGIATQGKVDIFINAWTTHLKVWYSLDQYSWKQAFNGQVLHID